MRSTSVLINGPRQLQRADEQKVLFEFLERSMGGLDY